MTDDISKIFLDHILNDPVTNVSAFTEQIQFLLAHNSTMDLPPWLFDRVLDLMPQMSPRNLYSIGKMLHVVHSKVRYPMEIAIMKRFFENMDALDGDQSSSNALKLASVFTQLGHLMDENQLKIVSMPT